MGIGGDPSSAGGEGGKADGQDAPGDVLLTADSDGGRFDVLFGQRVVLELPRPLEADYAWEIAVTDDWFAYPADMQRREGANGEPNVDRFVWETGSSYGLLGEHTVTLEYRRTWESDEVAPAGSLTFTVNVVEDGPRSVVVTTREHGETVTATVGDRVVAELPANGGPDYTWSVVSTEGSFASPSGRVRIDSLSGGVERITWDTASFASGLYEVRLHYASPTETDPAAEDGIAFVIDLRERELP